MPKPAPNHCQSSTQSVRAGGRHLSRYPLAVVAFGGPGTYKQHTPHITAICGGARGQPALKLQVDLAPAIAQTAHATKHDQAHVDSNYKKKNPETLLCVKGRSRVGSDAGVPFKGITRQRND